MPNDKVVVITGATAGIGRALAHRFARDGAQIALLARGTERLEETAEEVMKLGGRPLTIELDVVDFDAVDAAAEKIEQELGPIDIWINNAAVDLFGRAMDMSPDEIRRVSDVTYHGAVWGTKAALSRMRERGRGKIVHVGSAAAYLGIPLQSVYSAAKHALRGFTDALRVELLHDGIDVELTMVHPSAVNTPLYTWARNLMERELSPVPPIYEPELIAEIVYWAAHSKRRHVLVGWTAIAATAANNFPPRLVDWVLARTTVDAQQGPGPAGDEPGNLFEPVEGDFGVRGKFSDRAKLRAPLVRVLAKLGVGGMRTIILLSLLLGSMGGDD